MNTAERTIVVGWDGSPASGKALDWAVERAMATAEAIQLTDAVTLREPASDYVAEQAVEAEQVKATTAAQHVVRVHPSLVIDTRVLDGDPYQVLLDSSDEGTLVVVGTKERHGHKFRFHWSLGARLAGAARGPVAIIPAEGHDGSGVVVGVDGSDVSLRAALFAAAEAQRRHEELHVVHAWSEPMSSVPELYPEESFTAELEDRHGILLGGAIHAIHKDYPQLAVSPHLVHGSPVYALNSALPSPALLVLGARQVHGIEHLLLGSVSHAAVIGIRVPTIIIPARHDS